MTDEMTCLVRDVRLSIQLSNRWASIFARIFSGAGYAVVSFVPRNREGDGAPGGATIVRSVARSLSRDAGASWRAIAGVFLYCAGPRFTWIVRFSRRASRFWAKRNGGRSAPVAMLLADGSYWPSGGAPGAARVREKRPLPAAGAASDPTRLTHVRAPSGGPH
jgi:hypothetical protein